MAYYKGKDIEKSRGNAIKELIVENRSIAQVVKVVWNQLRPRPKQKVPH